MRTFLLTATLATITAQDALAQIQIPPPDLPPGAQYRILFVTASTRDATSADIADYNAFVAADAAASPQLAALNTTWRALANTATTTATANTNSGFWLGNDIPIYLPNGLRVENGYAGLWGGTLLNAPTCTSLGGTTPAASIWTGGGQSGNTSVGNNGVPQPLGDATSWAGDPSTTYIDWMSIGAFPTTELRPLYGMSGVLTKPVQAAVEDLGPGCDVPSVAFRFVPNGNGGHDVFDAGAGQFDADIGVLCGATADEAITATGLDLGFPFPFPSAIGTAPEQFVRIDPNGRILPDSSGINNGSWNPTVNAFLNAGFPMVCPMWTDINVQEPNSDGIYWKTEPGKAVFTWNDVPQFSYQYGTPMPLTFQCTLFDNGEVLVVYEDLSNYNVTSNTKVLIGISSGNVGGTGTSLDLSQIVSGDPASGAPAFEFFESYTLDLHVETPTLLATNTPTLGSDFTYLMWNAPAEAQAALYLIGVDLLPAPVPIGNFGYQNPCSLTVPFVDVQIALPTYPGEFGSASIAIPTTPLSLQGFELYLQGVVNGAQFTSPLLTSNTLRATVGAF